MPKDEEAERLRKEKEAEEKKNEVVHLTSVMLKLVSFTQKIMLHV